MEQQTKVTPTFGDYVYILYKWKKFLIINLIVITALATLYAFLLPKEYRATATIMIPPDNQLGGLSGITNFLSSGKSSIASMDSKLFCVSGILEVEFQLIKKQMEVYFTQQLCGENSPDAIYYLNHAG